jgi:hypothetical protein
VGPGGRVRAASAEDCGRPIEDTVVKEGVTHLSEAGDITFGHGGVVYSSCLILRGLAGGSRRSEELAAALRVRKGSVG